MKENNSSFVYIYRLAGLLLLVCLFYSPLSAQVISTKKDSTLSTVSFKSKLEQVPFSVQTRSIAPYQYHTPTNELMRWPNYPSTAAQMEERWKKEEQNKKLVPFIVDQVVSSWINGKKRTGTAQPPQF